MSCLPSHAVESSRSYDDEERSSERFERRWGSSVYERDSEGRPDRFDVREVPEKEVKGPVRKALTEVSPGGTEFQSFVNRNYGRWLPIYGLDAFSTQDQGFDAPVNSAPTDHYEIGPGDEIRVKVTGGVEMNANLVVDNTGFITLPRVGPILLAGVKRGELQQVIGRALSRYYVGYTLHVYTGTLRTISVYVVGQAARPGGYRVPATSSVLNALYVAGGVSAGGSLRTIRLMRGGQQVSTFDFYEFIANGSTAGDLPLRNGDVVHVGVAGPRVALLGSANVQAIFELAPQGTSLRSLLALAGGLPSVARSEMVTIDRIDPTQPAAPKDVISVDLSSVAPDVQLKDGDVISLQAVGARYNNMVSVRGHVFQPIRRSYRPGLRVSDLIPDARALYAPETMVAKNDLALGIDAAPAARGTARPMQLDGQGEDRVLRTPLATRSAERLVPADDINWNLASIERLDETTGQTQLFHFNLGKALAARGGADDPELRPGDQVVVYGDRNLRLPEELRTRFARIEGEVVSAGVYQLSRGETLRQLLARAGGPSQRAFLYGLKITRQAQVLDQREQLQKAASLLEDAISRQVGLSFGSDLTAEQKSLSDSMAIEMRRRAQMLRNQRPEGRIVLDLPFGVTAQQLPDLPLEDGDVVMIPAVPNHVTVAGAVYNPVTMMWMSGSTFANYIESAVPKKNADMREIYVVRANGRAEVVTQRGFFSNNLNGETRPGDTIFVPEEPVELSSTSAWLRGLRDWSQVIFQLVVGASVAKGL